jgi:hypothetical protein
MTLEVWTYYNIGLMDCNSIFNDKYTYFPTYNAPTWSQPFSHVSFGRGAFVHLNGTAFKTFDQNAGIQVMVAASTWSCVMTVALMLLTAALKCTGKWEPRQPCFAALLCAVYITAKALELTFGLSSVREAPNSKSHLDPNPQSSTIQPA